MKKRILSLLLAFAMAATLAPATALVGNSTAKAAANSPVLTQTAEVKIGANAGIAVASDQVVEVYPGQSFTVTLQDTANLPASDAYYELVVTGGAALDVSGAGVARPSGPTEDPNNAGQPLAGSRVPGTKITNAEGRVSTGAIVVKNTDTEKAGVDSFDVTVVYTAGDRNGDGNIGSPYSFTNVAGKSRTFKFKVKVLPIITPDLSAKLGDKEIGSDQAAFADGGDKIINIARGKKATITLNDVAADANAKAVDKTSVVVTGDADATGSATKLKVSNTTVDLAATDYTNTLEVSVPEAFTGKQATIVLTPTYNTGHATASQAGAAKRIHVRVVEDNSTIVPVDVTGYSKPQTVKDNPDTTTVDETAYAIEPGEETNTFVANVPRGGVASIDLKDSLFGTTHPGEIKLVRESDAFTDIITNSDNTDTTKDIIFAAADGAMKSTMYIDVPKGATKGTYELQFKAYNKADTPSPLTNNYLDVNGDGDADERDIITVTVKVSDSLPAWGGETATINGETLKNSVTSLSKVGTGTIEFTRSLSDDNYKTAPTNTAYGKSKKSALTAAADIRTEIKLSTPVPAGYQTRDYEGILGSWFKVGGNGKASVISVPAGTLTRSFAVPAGALTGLYSFTATTYINGVECDSKYFQVRVGKTVKWTFDANGGTIENPAFAPVEGGKYVIELPTDETVLATDPLFSSTTPIRDGYIFKYWEYDGKRVSGTYNTGDGERTFKAIWTKALDDVSIVLDSNGATPNTGASTYSTDYDIDSTIEKSFVSRGRTQIGWSTEPGATVKMYDVKAKVTTDMVNALKSANNGMTLYAVWAAKTYTIKYEANVPTGQTLSASSVAVKEQTKTFGKNIKLRENTFHVPGYQFVGWYYSIGTSNNNNLNFAGLGGESVSDERVGNNGELSVVTLHAMWKQGHSYVLHTNETGSSPYAVRSGNLPRKSNRVGWFVKEWKGSDGHTYEVEESVNSSIDLNPVYKELPIRFNVEYLDINADVSRAYQASKHFSTFDVSSTTQTLPTRTAPGATFIGWEAYVSKTHNTFSNWQALPADAEKLDDIFKTAFNTLDMATILESLGDIDTTTNYDRDAVDHTVYFAPVWKFKVNEAGVLNPAITVPYGTPISVIERLVVPYVAYRDTNNDVDYWGGSVSSISFTNASTYKATKAGKYVLTASVKPAGGVDSRQSSYTVYPVEVTVAPKAAGVGTVVTDIAKIPDINLPGGVTVADVYAALSAIHTLKVTDENGRDYKIVLAGVSGGNAQWALAPNNMDIIIDKESTYNNAWLSDGPDFKTVIEDPMTFIFRVNLNALNNTLSYVNTSSVSVNLPAGSTVSTSNYQYAYVKVNVGTASSGEVVDPTEEKLPEGTVATTDAQVNKLLEQNYLLRFRNKVTGEHLYTADWTEYISLITNKNWEHETYTSGSNTFKASKTPTAVYTTPVYRLFSAAAQEHIYTKDLNEVQALRDSGKWSLDTNSTIYVSMDKEGTPYYRQVRVILINKKAALQHNYAPKAEFDYNNAHGWTADFNSEPVWYSPAN